MMGGGEREKDAVVTFDFARSVKRLYPAEKFPEYPIPEGDLEKPVTDVDKILVVRREVDIAYFYTRCILEAAKASPEEIKIIFKKYRNLFTATQALIDFIKVEAEKKDDSTKFSLSSCFKVLFGWICCLFRRSAAADPAEIEKQLEAKFRGEIAAKFSEVSCAYQHLANSLADVLTFETEPTFLCAIISQLSANISALTLKDMREQLEGVDARFLKPPAPLSLSEKASGLLDALFFLGSKEDYFHSCLKESSAQWKLSALTLKSLRQRFPFAPLAHDALYTAPDLRRKDFWVASLSSVLILLLPYGVQREKLVNLKVSLGKWSVSVADLLVWARIPIVVQLLGQWLKKYPRTYRNIIFHFWDDKGYPCWHHIFSFVSMTLSGAFGVWLVNRENLSPQEGSTVGGAMDASTEFGETFIDAIVFLLFSLVADIGTESYAFWKFFVNTGLPRADILTVNQQAKEKIHKKHFSFLQIELLLKYFRSKWLKYKILKYPSLFKATRRKIKKAVENLYVSPKTERDTETKTSDIRSTYDILNKIVWELREGNTQNALDYIDRRYMQRERKIKNLKVLLKSKGDHNLQDADGTSVSIADFELEQRLNYLKNKNLLFKAIRQPSLKLAGGCEDVESHSGFCPDSDLVEFIAGSESPEKSIKNPFKGKQYWHVSNGDHFRV